MTATLAGPAVRAGRARSTHRQPSAFVQTARVQTALPQADLRVIARHMFSLMLRNIASDGFGFADPMSPGEFAKPGCVIAAPSYPGEQPGVDQDYVFNWVRDAALTAMELVAAALPDAQPLIDYVTFAKTCQDNTGQNTAAPTLAHACFTIEGAPRPWTEQADGPALQTLAMLQAFPRLDKATQELARQVIGTNLTFLLGAYTEPTTNLWEEHSGYSFFARAAQLRCLREILASPYGIKAPPGTADAVTWLTAALAEHWNGTCYLSVLAPDGQPVVQGYDPNIDIVMACVYGAVPATDTRLLATAAQLRRQWADSASPAAYPINSSDATLGLGPLFGRYPGDIYDGDVAHPVLGGHPWALCTCNVAELYYRLAGEIARTKAVPLDELSAEFFGQVGIDGGTPPKQAAASLERAGDALLKAVVYHSDNLELSEQFDGTTGYEKSVRDLTWSYAAFLSAVRAKTASRAKG